MFNLSNSSPSDPEAIELTPSYRLPIFLLLIATVTAPFQWIVGLIFAILGVFLGSQAAILRFRFSTNALEIYRGKTQIRSFAYEGWYNWQIFWPPIPILCYFREAKSIHFMPILFDAKQLQRGFETYCYRPTLSQPNPSQPNPNNPLKE